jgi:uncharacterized protein DUF4349
MRTANWSMWTVLLLLPLLVSCGPSPQLYSAAPSEPSPTQDAARASDRRIAVTYRFTLRVLSNEIEVIQQRHMAECVKLGCSVLNTSIDRLSAGHVNAHASVRIKPESFDAFAVALAAPPAQITMRAQSTEDLVTPIQDVERRLEAKLVLRDRLTAMLHDQTTKTAADLITIERELAQAQTDIEALTAQRDNLRTRTDNVRVEITYLGAVSQIGAADLTPIYQAVGAVSQTTVNSVSWLISSLAAIVPWLPVIGLIWWITRRSRRRWRSPSSQPK